MTKPYMQCAEPEPGPSEDAALGQPSSSPGLEDSISGLPCESASTLGQQVTPLQ